MKQIAACDLLAALIAIAAARLLPAVKDRALEPLVQAVFDGTEPTALSAAIEKSSAELFQVMAKADHALARIARGCGLSAFDIDLLALAVLPCLDDRGAAAIAELGGPRQRRPTAGQGLRVLMGDNPALGDARAALWASPLWQHGLLQATDLRLAASERPLDPSPTLLALIDGVLPETLPNGVRSSRRNAQPPPARSTAFADKVEAWLDAPDLGPLHISGDIDRAAALLQDACARKNRRVVAAYESDGGEPPWRELALVALAFDGVVLLALPETTESLAPPEDLAAPCVLLASSTLQLRAAGTRPPARIALPRPHPLEQSAAWRAVLPLSEGEADALANQTWMNSAELAAIAARAKSAAGVPAARRDLAPLRPLRMASIHEPDVPWDRLALDDATAARLEEVIRRYRLRVPVRFRWRLDFGPPGLVCLLAGESGVGKTLTAHAVATRIGLPLIRADLSAILSKYIGETEKNLSELFAAAEGFSALLLFDEADALFGRRGAVEEANDRYANGEINYLLHRLESFEGIAVLATNRPQDIDEAFLRRFEIAIVMPRPGPAERLRLWRLHLPEERLEPGVDLAAAAERFVLTGGEIRNAALAAAYSAAAASGRIGAHELQAAITAEFVKKRRAVPVWPASAS